MFTRVLDFVTTGARLTRSFLVEEAGADMVEYALVLAMVVIVVAASMSYTTGNTLARTFNQVTSAIFDAF